MALQAGGDCERDSMTGRHSITILNIHPSLKISVGHTAMVGDQTAWVDGVAGPDRINCARGMQNDKAPQ